jgi:hypothetical protein
MFGFIQIMCKLTDLMLEFWVLMFENFQMFDFLVGLS